MSDRTTATRDRATVVVAYGNREINQLTLLMKHEGGRFRVWKVETAFDQVEP